MCLCKQILLWWINQKYSSSAVQALPPRTCTTHAFQGANVSTMLGLILSRPAEHDVYMKSSCGARIAVSARDEALMNHSILQTSDPVVKCKMLRPMLTSARRPNDSPLMGHPPAQHPSPNPKATTQNLNQA